MSKKVFNHKSLEKQRQEAISRLPHNDSQAMEDVRIYSAMSESDLAKLPAFDEDGKMKYYKIGDQLLGKLSLIQFVKSIKNKK